MTFWPVGFPLGGGRVPLGEWKVKGVVHGTGEVGHLFGCWGTAVGPGPAPLTRGDLEKFGLLWI